MVAIPAVKSRVIRKIFDRALKTVPRYAGNMSVIQQGAKSITMPPKKATMRDALEKREVKASVAVGAMGLLIESLFYCSNDIRTRHEH